MGEREAILRSFPIHPKEKGMVRLGPSALPHDISVERCFPRPSRFRQKSRLESREPPLKLDGYGRDILVQPQ